MKLISLDVETTTYAKGSPYTQCNKLCYVGIYDGTEYHLFDIEYSDEPYGLKLIEIQKLIDEADCIALVNGKFDLTWIRKYGLKFDHKRIHDCQLSHFILQNQSTPYPSLNMCLEHYGMELKDDKVKEYWEAEIDTPDIPRDILEEYLRYDVFGTYEVALKQMEEIEALPVNRQRLISLHNQDLLTLQEIEWNGVRYDVEESKRLATELTKRLDELDRDLYDYHNIEGFNTNSGDHLSCLLYGGTITIDVQYENGVFKTGARAGQPKFNWKQIEYELPRLVTPLKRTALKKEGFWSTGEDVLKSLKAKGVAKRIIALILERAKLEKLVGTYYKGLPELIEKMDWEEDTIHGQFNQCQARTGRLSSSKPNLQNLSAESKPLFYSRFL